MLLRVTLVGAARVGFVVGAARFGFVGCVVSCVGWWLFAFLGWGVVFAGVLCLVCGCLVWVCCVVDDLALFVCFKFWGVCFCLLLACVCSMFGLVYC